MKIKNIILQQIYNKHKKYLKHLNVKNPKMLIAFSGIPGSGKSYIAERLENRYKSIRIISDKIRNTIKGLFKNQFTREEINTITDKYIIFLSKIIVTSKNKTILLDCSVDRRFYLIKNFADKYNYNIFLISLNVSKEIAINRIKKRNLEDSERYLKKLDKWIYDREIFLLKNTTDITINSVKPINWKKLYKDIEKLMKSKDKKKLSKKEELVNNYLLHEVYNNPNKSQYFDAWEELHDMVWHQPEKAWSILLRIINKAPSEKILCNIGAGPLESLLAEHGEKFIKRVENQTRKDRKFYFALSCVWQSTMSEDLWSRVQQTIEHGA